MLRPLVQRPPLPFTSEIRHSNSDQLETFHKENTGPGTLEVVRRFGTLDCSVDGGDSLRELGGKRPGLERIESLVELLYLRNAKDQPITILPIQDAMVCRPSQRNCMPADTMFLREIADSGHRGLNWRLTIEGAVDFSDKILLPG